MPRPAPPPQRNSYREEKKERKENEKVAFLQTLIKGLCHSGRRRRPLPGSASLSGNWSPLLGYIFEKVPHGAGGSSAPTSTAHYPFPRCMTPAGRAVSRKGFAAPEGSAAAAQRPPCPGGAPRPRRAVGWRGHVARRAAALPAPTPPGRTWGSFKGRRRISWPGAQHPAGCLGARDCGTSEARMVPAPTGWRRRRLRIP